ncbi:MAG: tetraacyldisaccharide 4'-kinase [Planctomycetota bacterium]
MTPPILLAPLRLTRAVYERAINTRNAKFDAGTGVVTLDRPVISIGNLSVGGTGKTPMVRRIVQTLRDDGRDPCIAMRGYGASRRADNRSDEADEYAAHFDDLPIVAQPNRTEGLIDLFATERGDAVDCVVLDDGFQHRRIARQLDIVLLDATRDPFADELLPLGRLRERPASLARAHAAIVTHAEAVDDNAARRMLDAARAINPGLIIAAARHAWAELDVWERGRRRTEPVAWLAGKQTLAACAIGNPRPFIDRVAAESGSMLGSIVLRDHDPFRAATVRRIARDAERANALVVTAKDWAKLSREDPELWPVPVAVPTLSMQLDARGDELDQAARRVASMDLSTLDP